MILLNEEQRKKIKEVFKDYLCGDLFLFPNGMQVAIGAKDEDPGIKYAGQHTNPDELAEFLLHRFEVFATKKILVGYVLSDNVDQFKDTMHLSLYTIFFNKADAVEALKKQEPSGAKILEVLIQYPQ